MPPTSIKIYGAPLCPDCKRAKQFLGEQRIHYEWIDIEENPEGASLVQEMNNGRQIIPTIVFEDGSILVEPTNAELARKLGIEARAKRTFYDLLIIGSSPACLTAAIYCRVGGVRHFGYREERHRRPGGDNGAYRQLPRLSRGHNRGSPGQ